jgi:hypothetical protein
MNMITMDNLKGHLVPVLQCLAVLLQAVAAAAVRGPGNRADWPPGNIQPNSQLVIK